MKRLVWTLIVVVVCVCPPAAAVVPSAAGVDAVFTDLDSTHSAGCAVAVIVERVTGSTRRSTTRWGSTTARTGV